MTLQEKVLEVLGERALKPRAFYEALSGESPAAVDCALRALMRAGKVGFELGFYQRTNGAVRASQPLATKAAEPASSVSIPLTPRLSVPSAAVSPTPPKTIGPVGAASPPRISVQPSATRQAPSAGLTAREQEIAELAADGKSNREIAQALDLKLGTVEVYRHNIRKKTGEPREPRKPQAAAARPVSLPTPSAAAPLTAAPSSEGAEAATVGAGASNGGEKREVRIAQRPAFPPGLKSRLVESQRHKAEELQQACDRVTALKQELSDIEELVRMAMQGEGA